MVRRMLNMMYQEVRGLHQAAYVLALFAFGSQALALLRDRMLAHEFGAGPELDIYYAAFRIPDLLFVLFASTLSVYVLIPFVSRAMGDSESAGGRLLSQIFTLFLVGYSLFAAVMFILTPTIIPLIFAGMEDQTTLIALTRLLLIQPFFLGLSSLFGVVTQLGHRFVLYAISPLVYNLGIIVGIVAFYPFFGLLGLGIGVVFGAAMHLLVQLPFVRKSPLAIRPTWFVSWRDIRPILALSVPRVMTLSMQQLTLLFIFGIASAMTVGSVAIFQLAHNLQSVPLAVIGVSYSVAAFPLLSELFSRKHSGEFVSHIVAALRHIIFWAVPATALVIVLRAQIVRVVLGSGAFDWGDTRLTAAVLALMSLSLLAQAIGLVVVRSFYAGGRTLIPFVVTLAGSVLAIVSAYLFMQFYLADPNTQTIVSVFMRLEGVVGSEILALAFGYTIAMIAQAVVLLMALSRTFSVPLYWMWRSMTQAFCAATIGGLFAYVTLHFIVEGIDQERFMGILIQGLLAGCVGIFGAAATYSWFKSPELAEVYQSFQKKILKTDVVAPQEDVL
jgi:putative peptidoglycan lipid II flippase